MLISDVAMVLIGGFLGAIIRSIISGRLNRAGEMPAGTLLVNLAGVLLIGFVFGLELPLTWKFLLASGLAGALTTFSTMHKELLQLWQGGIKGKAIIYLLISYPSGILLAYVGYVIGGSL